MLITLGKSAETVTVLVSTDSPLTGYAVDTTIPGSSTQTQFTTNELHSEIIPVVTNNTVAITNPTGFRLLSYKSITNLMVNLRYVKNISIQVAINSKIAYVKSATISSTRTVSTATYSTIFLRVVSIGDITSVFPAKKTVNIYSLPVPISTFVNATEIVNDIEYSVTTKVYDGNVSVRMLTTPVVSSVEYTNSKGPISITPTVVTTNYDIPSTKPYLIQLSETNIIITNSSNQPPNYPVTPGVTTGVTEYWS